MASYSKYHARPCTIDGLRFASQLEARRYQQLKLMERAGEISELVTQPVFVLQEKTVDPVTGKTIPRQLYIGDFLYRETATGKIVCEDTKGVETQIFRLKINLVRPRYPEIEFRVLFKNDF